MVRHVGVALVLSFLIFLNPLAAQERDLPREALAIEAAVQQVIKKTDPAVASVLVSRSDAYRKIFHQTPPDDSPGQLGGFDPGGKPGSAGRPATASPRGFDSRLEAETHKYDLADPAAVPDAYGSAVTIDAAKGLLLTNYHVVRDATKVFVRFAGGRGSYADIHAADPRSDLAVLRVLDLAAVAPLKTVVFGDGDRLQKGQFVVLVAHPYAPGFKDSTPSASWGMISGLHRSAPPLPREEDSRPLPRFGTLIQTDARLHLDCSGGALFNLQGELIGLTTARAAITGSDMVGGFAVPLNTVWKRLIDRLRQGLEVEYGFLGVRPPLSPPTDGKGVPIDRGGVTDGSPAQRAGLQPGDRIVAINGIPIRDSDDLFLVVGTLLAGTEVRIETRDRRDPVKVELAKHFVPGKIIAANRPAAVRGFRVDYTSVLMIQNVMQGSRFFHPRVLPGVYVSELQPGSRAEKAGLRINDVITQVNGQEVHSPAEFYREAAKVGNGPMELTLARSEWNRPEPAPVRIE